jgi:arylsulfatase A-like enzyme
MRRYPIGLLIGLAIFAVGAVACSRKAPHPPVRRIVLVSIDTLRADHLGCYGYPRPTSPHLDALAASGAVFEQASTPSPWTLPAHASLLTGLYPSHHGMKSVFVTRTDALATLASELASHGFVTAAAVNTQYLAHSGLERAFEEFFYLPEQLDRRDPARPVTDQAVEWLTRHADQPLFLLVHYYDVHSDYRSEEPYEQQFARPYAGRVDGRTKNLIDYRAGTLTLDDADTGHLVDLYDAGIRQMDDELERLLAALPPDEGTLLLVTSDHGEEFREHGGVLHGRTQFEEVVHVPLIVRGWDAAAGTRIATPVSLVDVMPTILAAAGVSASGTVDGIDLGPLLRGATIPDRYLVLEADHNATHPERAHGIRHGSYKLHYDRVSGSVQLFDLATDPVERVDVATRVPEVTADLRAHLAVASAGPTPVTKPTALTPEQIERLRSLGYLR